MRVLPLLLLLVSGFARAGQVCADPPENARRLAFIQKHLREDAGRARVWTGAWGAGYGLLVIGQTALAASADPGGQADLYVGAVSSVGALTALLAAPLEVMGDADTVDALALAHPASVDCELLAQAEQLLVRSAEGEAAGHSLLIHGASVLYNVVFGLVLGLVFDRWTSGAVNTVVGILIGEAMILTQPTSAEDTLRRYRAGELSASRAGPRPSWGVQMAVGPSRVGLQLHVSF